MRTVNPRAASLLSAVLFAALCCPTAVRAQGAVVGEAIRIDEGSLAQDQIVALSRSLVVRGECRKGATVLGGSATVSGRILGDLVVVGGDARLEAGARVGGDVFVFGGAVETAPGVVVGGRSVAYPTAPSTWMMLLDGPSLGLDPMSPTVLGAKLALIAAWLLVVLGLLATSREPLRETARVVTQESFRCFFIGLTGVLAIVLLLVLFSSLVGAVIGVPMVLLLVLFALLLKIWGTSAVFLAFGRRLLEWFGRRRERPLRAALVGLSVLGAVKLVPWVGVWVWTVITLIGVGATLVSKFGRMEPWLDRT